MRKVQQITELLLSAGATDVVMVGGYVRDMLLGIPSKDIDIEIYGLSYSQMAQALRGRFRTSQVGQSFNVLKVGNEIDLTIPRRESKVGVGHKGFEVQADPNMTFTEAASRRDFTINAIGMRADGTLCDPYDGAGDLKRGVLRAVSPAFAEDPLRVLRGMQFAARFGYTMDSATAELCRSLKSEFSTLAAERIYNEWVKWAEKGKYPHRGLDVLVQTGWIDCFPELAALQGVPQNPECHPEGDVFEHTRQVCKVAAELAIGHKLNADERTILMFAALTHDFGKPCSTVVNSFGIRSSGKHAINGRPIIEQFLTNLRPPIRLIENVLPLCRDHMAHFVVADPRNPPDRIVRRLAVRLSPSNLTMWNLLCTADQLGREAPQDFSDQFVERGPDTPLRFDDWIRKAEQMNIARQKPEPILLGRHLIERGIKPGPGMGEILEKAWQDQLDGVFADLPDALEWLDRYMNGSPAETQAGTHSGTDTAELNPDADFDRACDYDD